MHEFSGITVNNGEKDRFWIGFRELILADRSFILHYTFFNGALLFLRHDRVVTVLQSLSRFDDLLAEVTARVYLRFKLREAGRRPEKAD